MRTWSAVALGAVAGALGVAGLWLVSDLDDPARAPDATAVAEPPSTRCPDAIPSSVFATLGWRAEAGAVEHAGRCQQVGEEGSVTVGDLPVPAPAEDRRSAAAQVYDERCSGLTRKGATADLDVDWLPAGTTACARLLPTRLDRGVAELFLLEGDGVVQVRVAALAATSDEAIRAGLTRLVEASAQG